MSYCRFGPSSDVYVYCSGDYAIHIAFHRQCDLTVPVENFPAGWVNIGLPFDGQTLMEPTLQSCISRLESLRSLGYLVPQSAIDHLNRELTDEL